MTLVWYVPVIILFTGIFLLFITIYLITTCCYRRHNKSKRRYFKVDNTDYGEDVVKSNQNDIVAINVKDRKQTEIANVSAVSESSAEVSISDIDGDDLPVSAYGDSLTFASIDQKSSWLTLNTIAISNLHIQTSLIYSNQMRYVAGKIIQLDGLNSLNDTSPLQVKIHVVVLPIRKYALKTNWYDIQGKLVRINEYFKFKFKVRPTESITRFRLRAYGRKKTIGSYIGRAKCMGECYINLSEVVNARGGLTVWRLLTQGSTENILEEE